MYVLFPATHARMLDVLVRWHKQGHTNEICIGYAHREKGVRINF